MDKKDEMLDFINDLYLQGSYDKCASECKKFMMRFPNAPETPEVRNLAQQLSKGNTQYKFNVEKARATSTTPPKITPKEKKVGEMSEEERQAKLQQELNKLQELIGLSSVKNEVLSIVSTLEYERKRQATLGKSDEPTEKQSFHMMFSGNPGTGKTTVARILGNIFHLAGVIEKPDVVEVDRSGLVGEFIGSTAVKTGKVIKEAMGGVLFVDEAYALASGGETDFGREAIDALIKAMEDNRDNFIVILAGYKDEMRDLMKLNPGLSSRISIQVNFDDYNDEELVDIATFMLDKQDYNLTDDSKRAFIEVINNERVDEHFGNARTVRNIIEKAIRKKAVDLGGREASKEEYELLTPEDFGVDVSLTTEQKVEKLLTELNAMTGLASVKEEIENILAFVSLQERLKKNDNSIEAPTLHMVFKGNPGTGKTTMARYVGQILKEMGALKKGHIVEVAREDLVGSYIGHTAPKTKDKVKEAYGGILFVDEAYSLAGGHQNDFGAEAIATLIKEMEDNRDKLLVILAGYTNEMDQLLDLNPGIRSRIKSEVIFEDYNSEELLEIFKYQAKKGKYTVLPDALEKVAKIFDYECAHKDKNFGNGRLARNVLEQITINLSKRIMKNSQIPDSELMTIIADDVYVK